MGTTLGQGPRGLDDYRATPSQGSRFILLVQDQTAQLRDGEVPGDQADEREQPVLGFAGALRLVELGAQARADQITDVAAVAVAPFLLVLHRSGTSLQCLPEQ